MGLEILCNQVENEQAKELEEKEKKMMHMSLDVKLARIKAEKQRVKELQMVQQA